MAEWGEANKPKLLEGLALMERQVARMPFIAGEHFSSADITVLCAVDFMKPTRIKIPDEMVHLLHWHEEVSKRPSATA